jgi:hypothetical protein
MITEPLLDDVTFKGVSVGSEHRITHHFERERTCQELWRFVILVVQHG